MAKDVSDDKKSFKILIIILMIILIGAVIFAIVVKNKKDVTISENDLEEDDLIVNKQEAVVKEKEVDGLVFNNIGLITQDGQSFLTIEVKNNTSSPYAIEEIHIFLKDKKGNFLINYVDEEDNTVNYLIGYVGDTLEAGESMNIVSSIDIDITEDTYDLDYEIVK